MKKSSFFTLDVSLITSIFPSSFSIFTLPLSVNLLYTSCYDVDLLAAFGDAIRDGVSILLIHHKEIISVMPFPSGLFMLLAVE